MSNNLEPVSKNELVNLTLLIVEDSVSYSIELERIAQEIGFSVIGNVDNSADALDIIFSEMPDAILMDVEIKGRLSGIDIAKRIKHLNIPILYITSFGDDETYASASESNLIGYIVKPVDKLTLSTSLKLLINNNVYNHKFNKNPEILKRDDKEYIFFMKNNVYQKVDLGKIAFIKSENNYCEFILDNGESYLIRIKLSATEDLLKDKYFIRCHRQYIINKFRVKSINTSISTIKVLDYDIPYSRSKKDEILRIGIFLK